MTVDLTSLPLFEGNCDFKELVQPAANVPLLAPLDRLIVIGRPAFV